jgi:mRNA interferase HicA
LKQRDLINRFEYKGWWFIRSGGRHDLYTDGKNIEQIPRYQDTEKSTKDSQRI